MWRRAILGTLVAIASCEPRTLTRYGEIVLVVDVDAPVPMLASRFRLDVYSADGKTWRQSREVARIDGRDWPASLSLYSADLAADRSALVRLRAYPAGKVRDYRGERFADRPDGALKFAPPEPSGPPDEGPRLFDASGHDITPSSEPLPRLTIDRLFLADFQPDKVASIRIVLRSACFGTMANMSALASCVDTEGVRVPAIRPPSVADLTPPKDSLNGTFGAVTPCDRTLLRTPRENLLEDEACIDGGAFVLGNLDVDTGGGDSTGYFLSGAPERVAVLSSFRIDRFEVTVARWRDAVMKGFVAPDATPKRNEAPTDPKKPPDDLTHCTYSDSNQNRENHPVNCVSWTSARAYCQFIGGDLPTEAQWEYAAQVFGRPIKTSLPWGEIDPQCDTVVFGRLNNTIFGDGRCLDKFPQGVAPANTDAATDKTIGADIVGMGGNLNELTIDSALGMNTVCWLRAPLHDPTCIDPDDMGAKVTRGGDWTQNTIGVFSGVRWGKGGLPSSVIGFRCAAKGAK